MVAIRLEWTLLALLWAGVACHRPLALPGPDLPEPTRPPKTGEELERFLEAYGAEVAPPEATAGQVLDGDAVRRLAVANHPDVIAARARVEESVARVRSAGAWPNPELEGRLLFDPDARPEVEAALVFQLPLGGRIGAAEEQAAVELDLARLDLAAARTRALVEAGRWVARLAHARARLALFESLARRSDQYAALARSRQAASVADPLDVALLLADAARDRREVARARSGAARIEEHLRRLAGLAPGEAGLDVTALRRLRPVLATDALMKVALRTEPEVLRARLEVVRADRDAARAAAERWPDLHLGPAIRGDGDVLALGVQVGIALPLLQTGSGPYEEALARRSGALCAYRQAGRDAAGRVVRSFGRVTSSLEELEALLGEATDAVEGALELAEVRYQSGKLDVLRLLSVHRAFSDLKLEYLDLMLDLTEALLDLEAAVGRPVETEEVGS
jgi:cobalt-zinc-cadmium efflux system outer membrane protein